MSIEQPMTTEGLWHRYAAAWSLATDSRGGELAACLADDVVYTDPQSVAEGLDALSSYMSAFQRNVPGGRFEIVSVLQHHDRSLARWRLCDAAGRVLQTGTSTAVHESDGRLAMITGFFDPPGEQATMAS